ncbi:sucrose phosphorylase (plasmid) [Pseudoalteromonas lipolytica]|uniref:Sucrose phosphorylase n=1 Tax=Pseudoalteromonas lipolytica TaxID=570156 RepID=A0AAD0WEG1_9GAMM|nr:MULTISPECIES: sucrose phosphorylase [Pseudoalteromonas]AXV67493.1 sucrose phosphorylase [Pseudoalteromonas donghaensis]MBE0352880.1 sucrose phosphorylase [Pseudoalteromonas lipolytica LMEB 39]QLJ10084.1 sucrose phosphorylase [Pseudoalteromonas sp. JSTW]SFT51884.1 sucrose phosphorylase [Pseudoalteromonas lipolytica]
MINNKVQLITYADRITGQGIDELSNLLNGPLKDVFAGVHLLPFYNPIDGSDAGFDPIDHSEVDSRLGSWQDIQALGANYDLMADLIVNHVSAQSYQFKDVLAKGKESEFWDLFLTKDDVFPNGMSETEQKAIYRPRPGSCFTPIKCGDGNTYDFWTTFTDNQIDINVKSLAGIEYLNNVLTKFSENNVNIIRLDAAGYAIKQAGTNCFMLDETFAYLDKLSAQANDLGMETIAEIHSHYQTQVEVAKRVNMVYDFALPPLILHSLFSNNADALVDWLAISPRNCLTVLDTHDGIGIIDAGPMGEKPGLLDAEQIDNLVETIHEKSKGQSRLATGAAASNVDLYQVNCTYYNALGADDFDYLLARAIQFFAPGIPQVYYGGLFACENDMDLLANTNVGRDINRPYLSAADIDKALAKPVVNGLIKLIKLRNEHPAFNGEFNVKGEGTSCCLNWHKDESSIELKVNFASREVLIIDQHDNEQVLISLADFIA